MGSMKAALMRNVGEPLSIESVTIDEPGPSEVLVQVAASGVCHSDLVFLEGSYPHGLPTVLGHESAGIVRAAGVNVSAVAPGDRVIATLTAFCGRCAYCAEGRSHLCIGKSETRRDEASPPRLSQSGDEVHQFLDISSFAEQMLVHESTLVKVPTDVSLDAVALLGCGVATGLGAVFNTAGVRAGESVVVIGCGGVGLAAVQGARIAGAKRIVAIDVVSEKLDLAASLGATHVIDPGATDQVGAVREITGGHGAHHVIEAIGSRATAESAFQMLRRGGTVTLVGLIPGEKLSIPTDELFYERRIQGSVMGSNQARRDIPRYVDLYLSGQLKLDEMVTRRLALDSINEAFDDMRTGQAVRSVVVFD